MKKILIPVISCFLIFSCNIKKTRIEYVCQITSCKEEAKISVHDYMDPRPKYVVSTSCGDRKFVVYRKYNVGDTVNLTKIVLED